MTVIYNNAIYWHRQIPLLVFFLTLNILEEVPDTLRLVLQPVHTEYWYRSITRIFCST